MTITITTGYSVSRRNGRTLDRFDTLHDAETFAASQDFPTTILPFTNREVTF